MILTDADQLREALRVALEERDAARAEVERLRACSAEQGEQYAAAVLRFASELRTVAERQREALLAEKREGKDKP